MELLVITGMSGAGKSQAMKVMEDVGFYCMDNLPPALLPKFAELCRESKKPIKKVAVVVDIRGGEFFDHLFQALDDLNTIGIEYKILFLDASDSVLIKRYKELRRPHPLIPEGSLSTGIKMEREILQEVKKRANYIIDTSKLTLGMLRAEMSEVFLEGGETRKISISVTSFGFKNGMLLDGDLVFDVRFIPNPFYIPELKPLSGKTEDTSKYVLNWPQTNIFITKVIDLLEFLIPYYVTEGKTQLVIGIGCTGGFHRSVTIAEKINEILVDHGHRSNAIHRDLSE
ncbi:MAG: RNase adapter RapZ [Tissierellia bacterium]|nr:RNase adapter RapZ [Tissierellia bacterium]MDD4726039.1 RNase adapter RapZ [Tissierellia bacterium]